MSENLPAPENLLDAERIQMIKNFRNELTGFMLNYQFGIDEILTKINILKTEFSQLHEYAPIEHVSSRLKTPESIVKKVIRKGDELSLAAIKDTVFDIAGIRIVCSFLKDAYAIADMLTNQKTSRSSRPKTTSLTQSRTATRVCTLSSKCLSSCLTPWKRSMLKSRSAPLPWTSGQASSTKSTTNLNKKFLSQSLMSSVKMERIHGEVKSLKPPVETTDSGEAKLPSAITFNEIFGRDFSA